MRLFGDRRGSVCVAREPPLCILFLDFDGVVHPLVSAETFVPHCVACVNDVADALDARIVLSTAWRGPDWHRYNTLFNDRVIGHTPELFDLSVRHIRYQEIRAFLREQEWESIPWLALDDMPEMFPPGAPVYAVDGEVGLTREDAGRVLAWFEGKPG
jgi:hypothetical protein